jgi:hypothetical protein
MSGADAGYRQLVALDFRGHLTRPFAARFEWAKACRFPPAAHHQIM